jgi:hypothetical protein
MEEYSGMRKKSAENRRKEKVMGQAKYAADCSLPKCCGA